MSALVFVGLIVGWFIVALKLHDINERITRLENKGMVASPVVPVAPAAVTTLTHQVAPVVDAHSMAIPNQVQSPYAPAVMEPSAIELWLKQDFFTKLGAFLLLLAAGWFVSYAFANNWIGPMGRIMLGLMFGALGLVVGVWRIRTHAHQGSIFTVLGATTILLTIFAARELYDFFTPITALVMIFASSAFVAFVSVMYSRQSLAVAGLILGMIAPLFINVVTPDTAGLFFYLLLVTLGTLWIVSITGWSTLTPIALTIVSFYSLPYITVGVDADADRQTAFMFSFIFVTLFYVTNIVSTVRRVGYKNLQAQIYTALGTAMFLVTWVLVAAAPEWQSLLFVVWALVFAVGAYLVAKLTTNTYVFYLYGAIAVGLIGIATAAELSGPALVIAYLLEIGFVMVSATLIQVQGKMLAQLSFLLAIPGVLSIPSLVSSNWRTGVFHNDFVVVLLCTVVFTLAGLVVYAKHHLDLQTVTKDTARILLSVAGAYAVAFVWLVLHGLMSEDVATMIALALYTLVGISTFIYGKVNDLKTARVVGVIFITIVMSRLMLVEIWNMGLSGRIITFFVIGVMLVSTAFIKQLKPGQVVINERN
ncbi:MAG: hypothetical protein AUK16_02655 [Parcubacteria group bacterium CG2_30_44_11]|nr:MAG: hypothetical protein AUK16_02655 [Parcubacteria group bacterium CG2_30_44_11]